MEDETRSGGAGPGQGGGPTGSGARAEGEHAAGAAPGADGSAGDGGAGQESEASAGEGSRSRGRGWSGPLSEIQDVVGDIVDTALRGFGTAGGRFPRHDLIQVPGEGYRVLMDLPGVPKDELDVSTVGDELVVSGERKRPGLPEGSEVIRGERGYGRFRRAIRLPADVDAGGVEARLEDGVLQLTLPLRTESTKVRVDVE